MGAAVLLGEAEAAAKILRGLCGALAGVCGNGNPEVSGALTAATRARLFCIWVVREDCEGAIDLLREDHTGELVRHGEWRE